MFQTLDNQPERDLKKKRTKKETKRNKLEEFEMYLAKKNSINNKENNIEEKQTKELKDPFPKE